VEYRFPFGWKELEGIHNRGDWDLGRHQEATGESLEYFDPATEEKYVPWIVETSAGGDRAAFTFLIDAYREEEVRGEKRVVLGFNPELAPYKVAVLPLLKKREEIVTKCHALRDDLSKDIMAVYDDTAAIGKLYRRQDEIGTPWCVTIDVDSLEDGKATIRDRDSMEQIRVDISQVKSIVMERLAAARA
jgi:glycyl-tRNA synthetase